ncbi:MAG: hypothetical protein CMJ58_07290 [Planctomycetaceae bacterium]|nr:hypothetical protein [Planctomycetaceae bacterium]
MTAELLSSWLGWSTLINVAILAAWFAFFTLGHDLMYRLHAQMFRMSVETFDAIHYGAMAAYKLGIILLNLTPYVALYLAQQ